MKESKAERKQRIERMEHLDLSIALLMELGEKDAAFQLRVISDHHLRK